MSAPDDFEVRVMGTADWPRVLDFLRSHYYREEPLTVGTEPPHPDAADIAFLQSNVQYGTCLMVLQRSASSDSGERIVGAVVAGPKTADEAAHLAEEAAKHAGTKWGRILSILTRVEAESNCCERFGVLRALHTHALGVDVELRGRAIGIRLMTALAARGRELEYPLLCVDCTSVYSAALIQRLGFELINTLRYADHVDDLGNQLIRPPAPHDSVQTYALRL